MCMLSKSAETVTLKVDASCDQQEIWKADHELAKECFRFEDFLGDFLECYKSTRAISNRFAAMVESDPNSYVESLDVLIESLWRRLLSLGNDIETTTLRWFRSHFGDVDNSGEFEAALKDVANRASKGNWHGVPDVKLDTAKFQSASKPISSYQDS